MTKIMGRAWTGEETTPPSGDLLRGWGVVGWRWGMRESGGEW